MKLRIASFALLVAVSTAGCAFGTPREDAASSPAQQKPIYTKEEEAKVRENERRIFGLADESNDATLDRSEKETVRVLKLVLGQGSQAPGMPPPEPAATALKTLKAAKVKVRLEPIPDGEGNPVSGDLLQLKSSYADRVMQLQPKMVARTASKAEMREITEGAKHAGRLSDLQMTLTAVSLQTMGSNNAVQSMSLQTVFRVSTMVRSRKAAEMAMTEEDYGLVRGALERQRRAEAIAATTMAMVAAYTAVINDGGDPKALEIIAQGGLKSLPAKVEVTNEEAKKYVSALGDNVDKVKARYEAMMRKTHGDARYEKDYKASVDAMFAQYASAQSQKSATEMAKDNWEQYKADVQKCESGIDPEADERIGPTCSEVYRAARTGDTSQLTPGAKRAIKETGGLRATGSAANDMSAKNGGREMNAVNGAVALANGDVDGALDAAGKVFPGDSTIGASLRGIQALRKGDAKGAIDAALTFVPVPGLKDAFGVASKLLFKG